MLLLSLTKKVQQITDSEKIILSLVVLHFLLTAN